MGQTPGTMVLIRSEQMGRGDDALGAKLLGTFLRTLTTLEAKPDTIVFYNGAARLLGPGSGSLDALRALEEEGVELLACITCLEFFGLTEKIEVGTVTNMREIAQRMLAAAKVITL